MRKVILHNSTGILLMLVLSMLTGGRAAAITLVEHGQPMTTIVVAAATVPRCKPPPNSCNQLTFRVYCNEQYFGVSGIFKRMLLYTPVEDIGNTVISP